MKITLNWLRQYVDFTGSPEELVDRLTMLGLEVEGVEKLGGEFAGIVVAQVLSRDRHPNADKLSLCRVADGQGERSIVCGAQNFQAGDKVPLILPGAALPLKSGEKAPFTIKVGRIRGVESQGMLCSAEELGIDPESIGLKREEGLLILRPDARVGQPFAEYLGRGEADVVYDLEVTPNRPDLNSVIGIAREIAAVTGDELRRPEVELPPGDARADELVAVRLDAPDLCPRYTARVARGLRVGPSPDWLRTTLGKVGLRSVNNVVDVTNYVMLETGQPLHAFDYRLITRSGRGGEAEGVGDRPPHVSRHEELPTIIVRRAADGERFTTLDGVERTLTGEMLLIADSVRAIALAGVMGGRNTEIHEQTTDVLIESACFNPANIRRTSKALGLRTDASYRFERGADIEGADFASRRCAQLLLQVAGGALAEGVVDAWPQPVARREITLRHARVNELLGIRLPPAEIEYHLSRLELRPVHRRPRPVDDERPPEPVVFSIPSFRVDLKREADLIEEVCRLHGVDRIPATPPRGAVGSHPFDAIYNEFGEVRRLLAGAGLTETQGQTLVRKANLRGPKPEAVLALANPLSSDMDCLRPSLLPGLLDILHHNRAHGNRDVQVFEIGRVFAAGDGAPVEGWRVALAMTGARAPAFWSGADREARCDAHDLKGVLDSLFEQVGVRGVQWARREQPTPLFLESAAVSAGGRVTLGELGQLLPVLAKARDLRDPVLLAELDLDQLLVLARRGAGRSFQPLPQFPATRRDVAMIVPETTTHQAVVAVVQGTKPAHLEAVDLFDIFRGGTVPAAHKSVAYALTYRAADRTLRDEEVNATHARVVAALKETLGAQVRE